MCLAHCRCVFLQVCELMGSGFCAVGNKESQGQGLFWNILFIYLLFFLKNIFFLLASISKVKKQFQEPWTPQVGVLSVAVTVQCIMKKEKKNQHTHKEGRFFTEGHSRMIRVVLGYIHSTSMCNSSISQSSLCTPSASWLSERLSAGGN